MAPDDNMTVGAVRGRTSYPVDAVKFYTEVTRTTTSAFSSEDATALKSANFFQTFAGAWYDFSTGNQKFSAFNDPYYIKDENGNVIEGTRTLGVNPFTGEQGYGLLA